MLPNVFCNTDQIQLLTNEVIKHSDILENNNNLLQTLIQKVSINEGNSNKRNKVPDVAELTSNKRILKQLTINNLSPITIKPDEKVKDLKSLFYTWVLCRLHRS